MLLVSVRHFRALHVFPIKNYYSLHITIQTNQKPEQRGKSIENDYEMSEIVLYQNKILMEDNKNVQALANLVGAKDDIVDRVAQLESLVEVS